MVWTLVRDVDDTHWVDSGKSFKEREMSFVIYPSLVLLLFYFSYAHSRSPEALLSLPLAALHPSVLSEQSPILSQQSLLSVYLWSL